MQETVVLLCSLIISATIGGMTGWFVVEPPFEDVTPLDILNADPKGSAFLNVA